MNFIELSDVFDINNKVQVNFDNIISYRQTYYLDKQMLCTKIEPVSDRDESFFVNETPDEIKKILGSRNGFIELSSAFSNEHKVSINFKKISYFKQVHHSDEYSKCTKFYPSPCRNEIFYSKELPEELMEILKYLYGRNSGG